MTYQILETSISGRRAVVAEAPDFDTAEAVLRGRHAIAYFEIDRDYPNCADAITHTGRIFAIQPADFVLDAPVLVKPESYEDDVPLPAE